MRNFESFEAFLLLSEVPPLTKPIGDDDGGYKIGLADDRNKANFTRTRWENYTKLIDNSIQGNRVATMRFAISASSAQHLPSDR